ncbi:hypothetical protein NIES4102_39150 [Chondrocystis sp. NIES-4102]|nr:hypothetical protein NIES4102_39150 [Chondrocystis sp. NIES-4102]
MLVLKNLLRLLAASTSLIVLLLSTNPALAFEQNDLSDVAINQPKLEIINLSIDSPILQLTNQSNNTSVEHLGCNCAVCLQGIRQ